VGDNTRRNICNGGLMVVRIKVGLIGRKDGVLPSTFVRLRFSPARL